MLLQENLAETATRVADVDALQDGTTALWEAVMEDWPESARALVAAGADLWRPLITGWSPGRLSLAGPTPNLFTLPDGQQELSDTERAAAHQAHQLLAVLKDTHHEGLGLVCVAGIGAPEAIRRLDAAPVEGSRLHALQPPSWDEDLCTVGVTTVPGGCIITQPWGYAPQMPGVQKLLSAGTSCYGLYVNAKSGDQGSIAHNGIIEDWDLTPGGDLDPENTPTSQEVHQHYLYRYNAIAYACAWAGLHPADPRAVIGPPDIWVDLPDRDYWHS
ncbi:ankyrin repeat domain-containing protein [Streptomyces roseoverticillatus]|uniref:ankyrin repeat domain-containing protein n=1 Tax=Streptomyces roseoverticillatus TaxID=66429 RepID=UPI000AA66ADA|nr:ankyrin repeat domain-containing protein [Streptomyces roseoverticillatus]